jgi:hypothetical protein
VGQFIGRANFSLPAHLGRGARDRCVSLRDAISDFVKVSIGHSISPSSADWIPPERMNDMGAVAGVKT